LVTAVSAREVNYQSQLAAGVVDVLSLERTFSRLVSPRQSLVDVHKTVDSTTDGDHSPASGTTNLTTHTYTHTKSFSCNERYRFLLPFSEAFLN